MSVYDAETKKDSKRLIERSVFSFTIWYTPRIGVVSNTIPIGMNASSLIDRSM